MLDLKVGYSCNNCCIHCVVEPRRLKFCDTGESQNLTYGELVSKIRDNSHLLSDYLVITGGEPTIRKDFGRLLKFLHREFPNLEVVIQTNGRALKNHADDAIQLIENGMNLFFVIAIHSQYEDTHNIIANSATGNPYRETLDSLDFFINTLGDRFKFRTETVLSHKNINDICEIVEFLINKKAKVIGLSYPHLDGFRNISFDLARNIGFGYDKLIDKMPKLYEIIVSNPEIKFELEEFPRCIWRDKDGKLLSLPNNVRINPNNININKDCNVSFVESGAEEFDSIFKSMRRWYRECEECDLCCTCPGVWDEVTDLYEECYFNPIKRGE